MAYRFHDDDGFVYFETGAFGHPFHRRRPERALCGQRRWPGSHVACVCYADHEGPHESAEGDQWDDENG